MRILYKNGTDSIIVLCIRSQKVLMHYKIWLKMSRSRFSFVLYVFILFNYEYFMMSMQFIGSINCSFKRT